MPCIIDLSCSVGYLMLSLLVQGGNAQCTAVEPPTSEGPSETVASQSNDRLRVLIETDAGGDPDDEQSLVRFLLYANEWDVEGIICNRETARDGENLNTERTGLGIVTRQLKAYGDCYSSLVKHDSRFPEPEDLLKRTVAGYASRVDGVELIIEAVDNPDPRPLWYCDWGTEPISANNLKRALDKILKERGTSGYRKFKNRLRIVGHNDSGEKNFLGDHATLIDLPFQVWIDTFSPPVDGIRWYHRFSALTARAGGFELSRDLLNGHGPLAALYPTNTTHDQKEGDTATFLYLVPTGMNDPMQPMWGSWAGRYGLNKNFQSRPYYWADRPDAWQGSIHRDNSLARWSTHLQNDFRARLDWCVSDFEHANHPPAVRMHGELQHSITSGKTIDLDASKSTDPDENELNYEWVYYPEAGSADVPEPAIDNATSPMARFIAPHVETRKTMHIVLIVTDNGSPPLTRYGRRIVTVNPTVADERD